MRIRDTLQRNIDQGLANQGQARIADAAEISRDDLAEAALREELRTFVCDGQYGDGIYRMLQGFLDNLDKSTQNAAWVSGFFGSGKSHLLKIFYHLWNDTRFKDGQTARGLVRALPDDVSAQLRELDTEAKRRGGRFAAAGSLVSQTNQVRSSVLAVLLRAAGLPHQIGPARLCLWLNEQGLLDTVKAEIANADKEFITELNNMFVSPVLARALLAADPSFARDEQGAKDTLRHQFPNPRSDISTDDFLHLARQTLHLASGNRKELPCTLLVLDEVQQYIGQTYDRSVGVTEVAETLAKNTDGRVLLVASGQSGLREDELLRKLLDRFRIQVALADADVQKVTRQVLLEKRADQAPTVEQLLESHSGEVSRHLNGSSIAPQREDQAIQATDYPLLPARRRFWEACFREIDKTGTHSQLRSQLRILQEALAEIADQPLGALIPADALYDKLATTMVQTQALPRELHEQIGELDAQGDRLGYRVCAAVFLITRLPMSGTGDIGVRPTATHVADLLVDDLTGNTDRLRQDVADKLDELADQGRLLTRVDGHYRLQTRAGQEWEADYAQRRQALQSDRASLAMNRDAKLKEAFEAELKGVNPVQGSAKVPRKLKLFHQDDAPKPDGQTIPIWVRDGWNARANEVEEAARAGGTDSAILYAFVPKRRGDDLERALIDAEAAERTLQAKGEPTAQDQKEAQRAMQSRRDQARDHAKALAKEMVAETQIYLGGGSEETEAHLADRLREGAQAAMDRLFPYFHEADSPHWAQAASKAQKGAESPLTTIGHDGRAADHPVGKRILWTLGDGERTGNELRQTLTAPPYGWPEDAIHAGLAALVASGDLIARTANNNTLSQRDMDGRMWRQARYRKEHQALSKQAKLDLRNLFQKLAVKADKHNEAEAAQRFVRELRALAQAAGDSAPLPAAPDPEGLADLKNRTGNDLMHALHARQSEIADWIADWTARRDRIPERWARWQTLNQLKRHADGLEEAADTLAQVEALRTQRRLLEDPDPTAPLRQHLGEVLRRVATERYNELAQSVADARTQFGADASAQQLDAATQEQILAQYQLVAPEHPELTGSDDQLAAALDQRPLGTLASEIDAVPGRLDRALAEAARRVTPAIQPHKIQPATIQTEAELEDWLTQERERIKAALANGPVRIG